MKKVGILLIHGLWEHKGRHDVNASWFKNLNIEPFLVDLPGHGKNADVFGHIEQWEEVENSIVEAYKVIESYEVKIVFGISFGGQVALHCILKNIIAVSYTHLTLPTKA